MSATRDDQQTGVPELALQSPGMIDRDHRIAVPDHDESRRIDAVDLARRQQRLVCDVSRDGGQETPPGALALFRVVETGEIRGPARVVALDPVGVQGSSHHARARFALRGDANHDQGADAVGLAAGDVQRGHRAHREAHEMERLDPEQIDEGEDVVDEHCAGEAGGGVPARAAVTARIGQVRQERLRGHRQLGGKVGGSGGAAAVEHHEGWPRAEHVVADVEAVGTDGGHPGDHATADAPCAAARVITVALEFAQHCGPTCSDCRLSHRASGFVRIRLPTSSARLVSAGNADDHARVAST